MRFGGYVVIGHDIPANYEAMEMQDAIKKIFEGDEKMNFGQALELVKNGKKITRTGWNGKDQYVVLGKEFAYKTKFDAGHGEYITSLHKDIGGKALVFTGTRGTQVGWLASQADMLAEDWIEYHEPKDKEKSEESHHPLFVETKSRRLQLLVQPSLYDAINAKATAEGISVNELVHTILEKKLCTCRCEKERDPWRKLITREEYRAGVQKLKEEHLDKKIEERGHEGMGALLFAMSGIAAVGMLENILFGEEDKSE